MPFVHDNHPIAVLKCQPLIPQAVATASLDVGFYQNNRLKATPYRDFQIRKDDVPNFNAVNFISLTVEEKFFDPKKTEVSTS